MLSAKAVAIPVSRLVAPGPEVTAQTPTFPDQNRPDIGIQDTVVEGTDRNAGVSEYLRHALQFQTLYDRIRSIHLCFPPFLI